MKKLKAVGIREETIEFEGGVLLHSYHEPDCCEHHWLSTDDLTMKDFEGLEFDLSGDDFFQRIEGYGIELIPIHGHSVKIPGYGSNNGYYSDDLNLVVTDGKEYRKTYDITECQTVSD